MSDATPALEALPGGKSDDKPADKLKGEKEIRSAISSLRQRHNIIKAAMMNVAAGRFDWIEVARHAHDLARIEAQVAALRFVLGEAETIR